MQLTQERTASQLRAELLAILRCTLCKATLCESGGGYHCSGCGRVFPRVRELVRFVEAQSYTESFGYQWYRYPQTQLDRADRDLTENDFISKTGFSREELQGKLVLDVGCGMGRFAEVATRWGARVVGIDLSTAVEVAARNLAGRAFVGFQADLFALPFAPESFDIIYSLGVLHHTPDCEKAFKVLPQHLKPGGTVAIWLYSGYNNWYRFSDQYRKITRHMPIRTLHKLLRVAVPVFYHLDKSLRIVPVIGRSLAGLIHNLFPVSRHPEPETRILDTLDWYSPPYQSKHTYEEVFRWFESCGLEALTVANVPLAIRGRKPFRDVVESSRNVVHASLASPRSL